LVFEATRNPVLMQQQRSNAMLPNVDHLLTPQPIVKNSTGSKTRRRRPPPNATEAALLAYGLHHGRLTAHQSCRLAGANATYFALVNAMNDHEREQLARGEITLTDRCNGSKRNGTNGNGEHHVETLLEHIQRSSIGELVQAVRAYGAGQLFDRVIAPALDQDAAGAAVVLKVND
jgi:hypothetical protein